MLEPGDPDFAAFGGGGKNGGNGVVPDEVEDELDAFNDETFGGGADEWVEDAHEELAQLTEEERNALKASNDFFEFGSDDEGCALEAGEPSDDHLGGGGGHDSRSLDAAADQLLGALKPKIVASNNNIDNGDANSMLKQQFQKLNLGQVAAPLTIETNEPDLGQHQATHPQQIVYGGHHHQGAPVHMIPQQQHFQLPHQQQLYNLMPPGHFQQLPGGLPGGMPSQAQPAPLQDPAIMSFSKIPVIGPFPGGLPSHPPVGHPSGPPHHHSAPMVHQMPGQAPGHLGQNFLGGNQHQHHQQHQQPPPTVMGFKTMQDIENEMLFGSGSGQQKGNHGGHAHNQALKQQMLNNRNLNYPGMRDRQQHSGGRDQQQNNHDRNYHGGHGHNDRSNNYQYHNQQQGDRNYHGHGGDHHRNFHGGGFNQQNNRPNNRDQMMDMRNNRHHQNDDNEMRYNQQRRLREDGDHQHHQHDNNHGYNRNQNQYSNNQNNKDDNDDNNWRWNEVRNRNRDSATRKDLMPGHVHTLGILRHSRARHHNAELDPEDDCLGATDTAPLINPTGDPRLDARLLEEQEELASKAKWFHDTEDEYAGLMSARDKQFITNIQLNQLKCDNPYVDDYYYTMFIAKKQKLDESERTGQMLLSENPEHESNYRPMQFENSLGKLQAVSVKAPRQIIDLPVVKQELLDSEPLDSGAKGSPNPSKNKRGDDYKSTLLQLERVYTILLDVESTKLKLSAIPTGVPLREQVTMELTRNVQSLGDNLSKHGLIPLYLQIRKGRELVGRALKHLPSAMVARISQEMLIHLWLVCKDGKSVDRLWNHLYRHSQSSSLGSLEAAVNCWVKGKDSALNTVLTSSLGVSTVLATLYRATTAAKRGQEKINVGVWRELMVKLISWHTSGGGAGALAPPLVTPQPLDIGFLLTLPDKHLHAWETIMTSVGLEK